jgi:hypothetical protein
VNQELLNKALMQAVSDCNVFATQQWLILGADPNYTLFRDSEEPNGYIQPTTPLRLVLFRASDSMLNESQLHALVEIASVLIEKGALKEPAQQIAQFRYGEVQYHPDHVVRKLWQLIL